MYRVIGSFLVVLRLCVSLAALPSLGMPWSSFHPPARCGREKKQEGGRDSL
jgi:hypothetical protein